MGTAYRSTRTAPWLSSAHDVSRRTARPPTLPSTAQCCIRTIKSHCNSRRPRRARKRRRRSLSSPRATALRSTRTDLWLSSALGVSPRTARPPTLRSIAHLLQRSQQLHRLWCPPPCQRVHQQRRATAYRSTRTAPWLSSAHDGSRRTARQEGQEEQENEEEEACQVLVPLPCDQQGRIC